MLKRPEEITDIQVWQQLILPGARWENVNFFNLGGDVWSAEAGAGTGYLVTDCSSTMDLAWTFIDKGKFPELSWVLAISQSKGRGQLGRRWVSVPGNLFATLRLPDEARALGTLLPLSLAVIIAEVLDEFQLPGEVKWPNDILVGGRKIGGILIEERRGRMMAGVGINVKATPAVQESEYDFHIPAACLSEFGIAASTPLVWTRIAKWIERRFSQMMQSPDCIPEAVEKRLAYKGDAVMMTDHNQQNTLVMVEGIDPKGGLIVCTVGGQAIVRSGQIFPKVTV